MSVTYRARVSVPLPAARVAVAAVRPTSNLATRGVAGAVIGTAAGIALSVAAGGFVPDVGLGVLIAMGGLFGGFNGGLVGLLSCTDGR